MLYEKATTDKKHKILRILCFFVINPNYGFIAIINFATKELLSLSLNGTLLENVKLDIGKEGWTDIEIDVSDISSLSGKMLVIMDSDWKFYTGDVIFISSIKAKK